MHMREHACTLVQLFCVCQGAPRHFPVVSGLRLDSWEMIVTVLWLMMLKIHKLLVPPSRTVWLGSVLPGLEEMGRTGLGLSRMVSAPEGRRVVPASAPLYSHVLGTLCLGTKAAQCWLC